MASQSRKYRGYESQKLVAEYVRPLWPLAEPTGAGRQGKDILATPGVAIEVKARANISIPEFIKQAKANSGEELPVLILRLNGQGPASLDDWPVVITLRDWLDLMTVADYGDYER
jgi:hypothetical protein